MTTDAVGTEHVTVLFTDMVDSTATLSALEPDRVVGVSVGTSGADALPGH